jgi:gas vesicle protein
MINLLRYTEELEKAGFSAEQAKRSVLVWTDFMDHHFATKNDLVELALKNEMAMKELRSEFKQDLAELSAEVKQDINDLRVELKQDITDVKQDIHDLRLEIRKLGPDLTIKMGIMMATSIGIISTIISLGK